MPACPNPCSKAMVIMHYFGRKENQSVMEFNTELKELTADDKNELATLCAKELNVALKD